MSTFVLFGFLSCSSAHQGASGSSEVSKVITPESGITAGSANDFLCY
jgi:hypothetical protein